MSARGCDLWHVVLPGRPEHGTLERRNTTEHSGTPEKPGTPPKKPGTLPKNQEHPQKTQNASKKPGTPPKNPERFQKTWNTPKKPGTLQKKKTQEKCKEIKRARSKMKLRTMNRNNLQDSRQEAFNYNAIALPVFGFFNETTLSWQLKHLFSTT